MSSSINTSTVKQRGAVLIALFMSLLLISGAALLTSVHTTASKLAAAQEVTEALAKAKEALISYAVTYTDNYGHNTRGGVGRLPCPANELHGSPAKTCGEHALGYLPSVWTRDGKRLDIDYREYFLNQNLWYAVSSEFRFNPSYNHLNPDAGSSLFNVGGVNQVVAVIIHPGRSLPGQIRNEKVVAANYLEAENADGDETFMTGANVNDRLVTITLDELMPLMERRVLGVVKDWLKEYYGQHQYYPYAARLGDPLAACEEGLLAGSLAMTQGNCTGPAFGEMLSNNIPTMRAVNQTWFGAYGWHRFIFYQVDNSCTAGPAASTCLDAGDKPMLHVNGEPAAALIVSAGKAITSSYNGRMQDRHAAPGAKASYLDTALLVDVALDYQLSGLAHQQHSNDQYLVVK